MKFMTTGAMLVLACGLLLSTHSRAAEDPQILLLWPNGAPGETNKFSEERDMTKPTDNLIAGKPLIRLGNVSKPTLTIYRPPADKDTGAAVVVCPGGGYSILAMDLEGTEVCEWLNSIGVTGVLLKYRVPKREGQPAYAGPLQDAQRSVGLVRHHAKALGIDSRRIGVLGFSAGGHLAATLSANSDRRSYPAVDDADHESCGPDFQVLIYPGGLTRTDEREKIRPEAAVTTNTPPTFIVMAEDDPVRVENAIFYALALKQSKVPVELHVYPTGGHGYGLRRTKDQVTTWPDRASDWMKSRGLLERK
jgi:acetyl esterase/lipase